MIVRIRTSIATWRIEVADTATLLDLKNKVYGKYQVPVDQQHYELQSNTPLHAADDALLKEIGIKHGDILFMTKRLESHTVKNAYVGEDGHFIAAGTTVTRVVNEDKEENNHQNRNTNDAGDGASMISEPTARANQNSATDGLPSVNTNNSAENTAEADRGYSYTESGEVTGKYFDPQCVPDPEWDRMDEGLDEVRPPDRQKHMTLLEEPDPMGEIGRAFEEHLRSRVSYNDAIGQSSSRQYAGESFESFEDIMRQMGRNPYDSRMFGNPANLPSGPSGSAGAAANDNFDSPRVPPIPGSNTQRTSNRSSQDSVSPLSPATRAALKSAGLSDEEIALALGVQSGSSESVGSSSSTWSSDAVRGNLGNSMETQQSSRSSRSAKPRLGSALANRVIVEKPVNLTTNNADSTSSSYSFVGSSSTSGDCTTENMSADCMDVDDIDDAHLAEALTNNIRGNRTGGSPESFSEQPARNSRKSPSQSVDKTNRKNVAGSQPPRTITDYYPPQKPPQVSSPSHEDDNEETEEEVMMRATLLSLGLDEADIADQIALHKQQQRIHSSSCNREDAAAAVPTDMPSNSNFGRGEDTVGANDVANFGSGSREKNTSSSRKARARERIGYSAASAQNAERITRSKATAENILGGVAGSNSNAATNTARAVAATQPTNSGDDEDLAALMEIAIQESLEDV